VIANELCNLKLDKLQLMKYALEIENHPDNLSAALFGGFVVSCVDSLGNCHAFSTEVSQYPPCYLVAVRCCNYILPPSFFLSFFFFFF
jgi:homoserine kinase